MARTSPLQTVPTRTILAAALTLAAAFAPPAVAADGPVGLTIFRGTGKPVSERRTFTVREGGSAVTFRMAQRGVDAVLIAVNDQPIVSGPAPKRTSLDMSLPAGANSLLVEFTAPVGALLELEIVARTGPQPPTDTTPPTIVATATPPPNAAGWNNTPVTVTFTCSDTGSGIASCAPPVTVAADGGDQVVSGAATDRAGNSTSTMVAVNIDRTPPVVTLAGPTTVSSRTVILTGEVADALSGVATVACNDIPANVVGATFSCTIELTDGPNSVTATAVDRAGNSQSAPVFTLRFREATLERLTADPAAIRHGEATPVTFIAHLDADGVQLVELEQQDAAGNVVAGIGFMRDDGTNGDAEADDETYTLQTVLLRNGPQLLMVRASIAFEGESVRSVSAPMLLPVAVTESVQDVRLGLASALASSERAAAYGRLGERFNDGAVLDALSLPAMQALATALRDCTVVDWSEVHSVCSGTAPLPAGVAQLNFLFVRDALGQWRLIAW